MKLINTTFCVPAPAERTFMRWMREVYRKRVETCGNDIKLLAIPPAEEGVATFALQFVPYSDDTATSWQQKTLPSLAAEAAGKPYMLGREQLLYFTTVMEIIND